MMLLKEKQQREEAEKQRKELEERLRQYEEEFESAKIGWEILASLCLVTYNSAIILCDLCYYLI